MYDTDFDSQRLIFHPGEVAAWLEHGHTKGPLYTELELTTTCNQHCSFCGVDHLVNRSQSFLEETAAYALIDALRQNGNKSLMISGHGEPLVHEKAPDIIAYASRRMCTSVTTNGTLLDDIRLHLIDELKWIRFSVNGYNPENYARIHGSGADQFHKVLRNIERAVERKAQRGLNLHIGVQLILLPDNAHGLFALAKVLKNIGVDYFSVKPYSQHPMSLRQHTVDYRPLQSLVEALTLLADERFRVVLRLQSMKELGRAKGYDRCHGIHFLGYVSANGDVWGCNVFVEDKRFWTGNINEHSFGDIWHGDRRSEFLGFIENGLDLDGCRDICRMHACNKYLWRLRHPFDHDDFI